MMNTSLRFIAGAATLVLFVALAPSTASAGGDTYVEPGYDYDNDYYGDDYSYDYGDYYPQYGYRYYYPPSYYVYRVPRPYARRRARRAARRYWRGY
jgi:hypothetical protein